jgi:hypothetical protein
MSKLPITPPVLFVAASDVRTFTSDSLDSKNVLERGDGRMRPVVPINDANQDRCGV